MIYLDNAATTCIDPAVLRAMAPFQGPGSGNASAVHQAGVRAATAIEKARISIAQAVNAAPDEIVFTGSGTEANNLALKGAAFARKDLGRHIITTAIEHDSVLAPLRWLATQGFALTILPVDREGSIDPAAVEKSIRPDTIMVSVMHANNEIGTIEPVEAIATLCRSRNILFHTDACQSLTHVQIDVARQNIDLATFNAHKLHGPRGVGALYVRSGITIEPLHHGGGQENGLRSGTYNTEGIVGFATAVALMRQQDIAHMQALRDYFIDTLLSRFPAARLNGSRGKRLCNNINLSFTGIDGRKLFAALDATGIVVATGSACHANRNTSSHVLAAIGCTDAEMNAAIRFSLSKFTTREEIDRTMNELSLLLATEALHV